MRLELKDENNQLLEIVEIDDYVWECFQKKAKELNISEEQLFEIVIQEYARKEVNE